MKLPINVNYPIQVKAEVANLEIYGDSRVEEITPGELMILWPTAPGGRIPVSEQQALTISFSRNHRAYEFDVAVTDRIEDPVALLIVRPTGPVRGVQRRNDVRIRALAPVELAPRVVGMARYKEIRTRLHRIKSQTVTVSAGGFSIRHHTPITAGTVFDVSLILPGEGRQPLTMSATTVRCTPLDAPGAESSMFDIAFAFERISENVRCCIVRFVFGAQREERLEE